MSVVDKELRYSGEKNYVSPQEIAINQLKSELNSYKNECEQYKELIKNFKKTYENVVVSMNYQLIIYRQMADENYKRSKELTELIAKIEKILSYSETHQSVKFKLISEEIKKHATEEYQRQTDEDQR